MTEIGALADPREDRTPLPSLRKWAVAIVGLLVGLAVWRGLAFGAPYGGDWAQYMSHAKALVEGRSYDDIGYLFSPYAWLVGPAVYPPGLPLTLTPFVAVFGESTVVPRLLMHAFLALFLVSIYRYFARDGETAGALGAVVLVGTSFLLADTANIVASDLGMCALVWCALAVGEESDQWGWPRIALLGLLGALAIGFRVAAAPLVPALGLWALLRYRSVRWRPWIVVGCWVAALLVVLMAFGPGEQATEAAARRLVGPNGEERPFLLRTLGRTLGRLRTYRWTLSEAFLYPFPFGPANNVYHVLAVPVTALGLWGWIRRDWGRLGLVFGAGTIAMLMVLPVWAVRYGWVLTPFVCFGLVRGVSLLSRRIPRGSTSGSARFGTAVALLIAVLATFNPVIQTSAAVDDDSADWKAMGVALQERSGTASVRAASNRPRMFTWYTGIPATGLPDSDLATFLDEVRRLDLTTVVVSTVRSSEQEFDLWLQWQRENPEIFRPLITIGAIEAYAIYVDELP